METKTERVDSSGCDRQIFMRRHVRYEVLPYFVVLDARTFGVPPSHRKIQTGFDVDPYGNGFEYGYEHGVDSP